jgi:hypothetical protein
MGTWVPGPIEFPRAGKSGHPGTKVDTWVFGHFGTWGTPGGPGGDLGNWGPDGSICPSLPAGEPQDSIARDRRSHVKYRRSLRRDPTGVSPWELRHKTPNVARCTNDSLVYADRGIPMVTTFDSPKRTLQTYRGTSSLTCATQRPRFHNG